MIITSKDNGIVKKIKKLKEKKYRDQEKSFIIEGIKLVKEAIEEKAKIRTIIICEEKKNELGITEELENKLSNYDTIYVTEKIFQTLTNVVNPQGILAVIEKNNDNQDINYAEDLYLILDDIQDPGNMGTILRTADSLNFKQIIVSKGTADIYNPKVVRSTMGAIFRIKVIESENLVETIKEMQKNQIKIVTTSLQTTNSMYDIDYTKTAIVIGNEANGVSKAILDLADEKIKIPMPGKTESLNASIATAVILYEAMRNKLK